MHRFARLSPRVIGPAMLALLVLLAGLELWGLGRRPQNMLLAAPALFRGLYPSERSATLPGSGVLLSRVYHWSSPDTAVAIRPLPGGPGALELEYHDPATGGVVSLGTSHGALGLPPTTTLRRLHALLPPGTQELALRQHGTVVADDTRSLGLLLSDARWWALPAGAGADLLRSLPGPPLTLALGALLLVLLGARSARLLMALVAAALALALAGLLAPWATRALQPALQIALGGACLGAGVALLWRRPVANLYAALAGVWLVTTLLFWTPRIDSDGVGYYAYVRSAIVDGDLDFANEFDPAASPLTHTPDLAARRTPTGRVVNLWSVGPALAWAPAGLLAHALGSLAPALGVDWKADGYAAPYVVLVTFVSALAGLGTLLGCFAIARRFAADGVAALAAASMYCGSNLLYYALWDGAFAHSLSAAAATWFVYAALRLDEAPSLRRWLALGVAAGLMLLMYWVTALLLVLPVLLLVGSALQRRAAPLRQTLAGALLAGCAGALCLLPQLLVWRYLYGVWALTPQGSEFVTPGGFHLLEMLTGAIYGVPWWTPAYGVGLLGAVWLAVRRPHPGVALLAAVALYATYNATLPDWHGSGAFGLRRFTALAPFLAPGLALVFERLPGRRSRAALAGALVVWSLHMTSRYVVYSLTHDYFALLRMGRVELLVVSWPEALRALGVSLEAAWPLRVLRHPSLGGALLLAACAALVGAVALLVWRPPLLRARPSHNDARHTIAS